MCMPPSLAENAELKKDLSSVKVKARDLSDGVTLYMQPLVLRGE